MTSRVPVQFRTHPLMERKRAPRPYLSRMSNAVILDSLLRPDGGAEVSLVVGTFEGRVVTETLYFTDEGENCREYSRLHVASSIAGADSRIDVKPMVGSSSRRFTDSLGYDLRTNGYRRGMPIVVCDIGRQISGVAVRWGESRRHSGGWSLELPGLSSECDGLSRRPWSDAPRVLMVPAGERVLAWWGSTVKEGGGDLRRPHPKSGPIVDVLNLAGALVGRNISSLFDACGEFGVEAARIDEPDVDGLRGRARSMVELHWKLACELRSLELGLNPGFVASTGSIATALMAQSGMGGDRS